MTKKTPKIMKNWKYQQAIFVTLLFAFFLLAGLLAIRYDRSIDITNYQGNSLNKTSIQVTQQLKEPLSITAFVSHSSKSKQLINRLIEKYRKHADITLDFKNPNVAMNLVREYDITHEGQLLLNYQGKTAIVDDLSETSITRGIYSVLQRQIRHIVFVSGHKEIFPKDNTPFSQLKKHLQDNQLSLTAANLALTQKVPDNTDLLVIATPQTPYSKKETQAITDYISQGGQLLWFSNENSLEIPELSKQLAAKITPATLLNQSGKPYQFNNSRYLAIQPTSDFPPLQSIMAILAMPNSSPVHLLDTQEAGQWQALPFLQVTDKSYLQQEQTISQIDTQPFIGVQLSPKNLEKNQRVVLLGNIDFLRNEWIGQGENIPFAVQLFRYLSTPSNTFIRIEAPIPDAVIISEKTLAWFAILLIIGVPLIILIIGKIVVRKC